eukprot:GHVN01052547.1.p2 GENE.GHVN01052547.1~~GHVN01052547.1.p2  ORF type:complete len:201 (+),score=31.74 GHVN01052547.1:3543-4145(+)
MKLFSCVIYRWHPNKPVMLSTHLELGQFGFFQRSTVKEHIIFHSRLIVGRTDLGTRQSIEFQQQLGYCHAYVHPSGLAAAACTDAEYPVRVVFSMLSIILRQFEAKFQSEWATAEADTQFEFPEGEALFTEYQNPMEADKLLKVQNELDEVKDVMLKNIDDLFQRGETLDSLMDKSEDLSAASTQFYRTAKKNNQCCSYY